MTLCRGCGQSNADGTQFCRYCGIKLGEIPQQKPERPQNESRRPYSWQTDEFQTQNETRPIPLINQLPQTLQPNTPYLQNQNQSPAYYGPGAMSNYRCPYCSSTNLPRIERRMSTSGWIVFAVLLIAFFPLFWIGFMIKEDVRICPTCGFKFS